jgi:hypothetical protein
MQLRSAVKLLHANVSGVVHLADCKRMHFTLNKYEVASEQCKDCKQAVGESLKEFHRLSFLSTSDVQHYA